MWAVHPHARGERDTRIHLLISINGSSPRPWGTHLDAPVVCQRRRFIPTPVGNAWLMPAPVLLVSGSSPRPWGTRLQVIDVGVPGRFIPTPVGNALARRPCPSAPPVHPHARGERLDLAVREKTRFGSSPRPWGTPFHRAGLARVGRFIPTPVGNAVVGGDWWTSPSVHPHARGERELMDGRIARAVRFIPTPVGNACTGWR